MMSSESKPVRLYTDYGVLGNCWLVFNLATSYWALARCQASDGSWHTFSRVFFGVVIVIIFFNI